MASQKPEGLRTFYTVWTGQLVSFVGSELFWFAVGVWLYQKTDSVLLFTLIVLFDMLPGMLLGPYAGAIADRKNRRWLMILGDCGAGLSSLIIATIIWTDASYWFIFPALVLGSISAAFQFAAYDASIVMMVPKEQLGRVNGFLQFAPAFTRVVGPIMAGALLNWNMVGFTGLVMIDFGTFLFAIATLLMVTIPQPPPVNETHEEEESVWQTVQAGFKYLGDRKALLMLIAYFFFFVAFTSIASTLLNPLVLSTLANPGDKFLLGLPGSAGGIAMILGSMALGAWAGPKSKSRALFTFSLILGPAMILCGVFPSVYVIAVGYFVYSFCLPFINTMLAMTLQTKIEPARQGVVMGTAGTLTQISKPVTILLIGILADNVFEPLMKAEGALAGSLGQVLGTGTGRGIGLMYLIFGFCVLGLAVWGFLNPRLNRLDEELPDMLPGEDEAVAEPVVEQAAEAAA